MPKRSRSESEDINVLAKSIVEEITEKQIKDIPHKNPHAVALGRLGGLRGGKARARKLSPNRRKEIARNAAKTRWKRKSSSKPSK